MRTSLLQNKLFWKLSSVVLLFCYSFIVAISETYAATEFVPLVGIPGITDLKTATLPEYINAIYLLLIGLGGLIAVVRISWIGVKYSMSDSVIHKIDAKKEIMGAFMGLAILLIPYIVLIEINPNLTNLNVLKLDPINVGTGVPASKAPASPVPPGTVLDVNGAASTAVTRSACEARAEGKFEYVFTNTYVMGTVQYGTCVITTKAIPATTKGTTLLWTGMGLTEAQCNASATARTGVASFTQATGKCEVWNKI